MLNNDKVIATAIALLVFTLIQAPIPSCAEESPSDLISQLGKSDSQVQNDLVKKGAAAVPLLVDLLNDEKADGHARMEAALILGKIGGPTVVEPLRRALSYSSYVKIGAIEALKNVGKPAATALVDLSAIAGRKELKNSDEEFFAERAVDAIAEIGIGSREAVNALVARMARGRDGKAAFALSKLGNEGVEKLLELAEAYQSARRSESERRFGESWHVVCWGSPQLSADLIPMLEHRLRKGTANIEITARALAGVGLPAKPTLMKMLEDDDVEIRARAAVVFSWMKFFSERYKKEGSVPADSFDDVFAKLSEICPSDVKLIDWRVVDAMLALNEGKTLERPELRKLHEDMLLRLMIASLNIRPRQYTVWAFKLEKGKWVKDESRSFVGDEAAARKRVEYILTFSPNWTATSDLPSR